MEIEEQEMLNNKALATTNFNDQFINNEGMNLSSLDITCKNEINKIINSKNTLPNSETIENNIESINNNLINNLTNLS